MPIWRIEYPVMIASAAAATQAQTGNVARLAGGLREFSHVAGRFNPTVQDLAF